MLPLSYKIVHSELLARCGRIVDAIRAASGLAGLEPGTSTMVAAWQPIAWGLDTASVDAETHCSIRRERCMRAAVGISTSRLELEDLPM